MDCVTGIKHVAFRNNKLTMLIHLHVGMYILVTITSGYLTNMTNMLEPMLIHLHVGMYILVIITVMLP